MTTTWDVIASLAMAGFWTLGAVAALHPSAVLARVRAGLVLLYLLAFSRRMKGAEDAKK